MITIRKANLCDDKDFAELMLSSASYFPILFGDRIKIVLQDLFHDHANLFSFEHVHFAEIDGEKAGMILGYDWQVKRRKNLRTGFLLFRKIGVNILGKCLTLLKFNSSVGRVFDRVYYISNIATYPQYREKGVGKKLILEGERKAKAGGAERIVLDVEKENISAINFYKKLGYMMTENFSISLQKANVLNFNRMVKEVK
jgi:ribosomal protein S18 acetylase RimI-like enzyme